MLKYLVGMAKGSRSDEFAGAERGLFGMKPEPSTLGIVTQLQCVSRIFDSFHQPILSAPNVHNEASDSSPFYCSSDLQSLVQKVAHTRWPCYSFSYRSSSRRSSVEYLFCAAGSIFLSWNGRN